MMAPPPAPRTVPVVWSRPLQESAMAATVVAPRTMAAATSIAALCFNMEFLHKYNVRGNGRAYLLNSDRKK